MKLKISNCKYCDSEKIWVHYSKGHTAVNKDNIDKITWQAVHYITCRKCRRVF